MTTAVGKSGYVLYGYNTYNSNSAAVFITEGLNVPATSAVKTPQYVVGGTDGMYFLTGGSNYNCRGSVLYIVDSDTTTDVSGQIRARGGSGLGVVILVNDMATHLLTIDSPNYLSQLAPRGKFQLRISAAGAAPATFDYTNEGAGVMTGDRIMQFSFSASLKGGATFVLLFGSNCYIKGLFLD